MKKEITKKSRDEIGKAVSKQRESLFMTIFCPCRSSCGHGTNNVTAHASLCVMYVDPPVRCQNFVRRGLRCIMTPKMLNHLP